MRKIALAFVALAALAVPSTPALADGPIRYKLIADDANLVCPAVYRKENFNPDHMVEYIERNSMAWKIYSPDEQTLLLKMCVIYSQGLIDGMRLR